MPERGHHKFPLTTQRKRKYPPIPRFHRAAARNIIQPRRSAPTHHDSYVLHSAHQIRNRRSHDAGAGIERPQRFPIRRPVRAQDPI